MAGPLKIYRLSALYTTEILRNSVEQVHRIRRGLTDQLDGIFQGMFTIIAGYSQLNARNTAKFKLLNIQ